MGKVEIVLNNPSKVYSVGSCIDGEVVLNLEPDHGVTGVKLGCHGLARVHWFEERVDSVARAGSSQVPMYKIMHFKSEESYLDLQNWLINFENEMNLKSGTHTFPFNFKLPSTIPASLESKIGVIEYYLEVNIYKTGIVDQTLKEDFKVSGMLDLNKCPGVDIPKTIQLEKKGSFLHGSSGKVFVNMTLQRTGYVPLESIEFTANVTNNTSRSVPGWNVYLVQKYVFHAEGTTKTFCQVLLEGVGRKIPSKETDSWRGGSIQIPSFALPSNPPGCKIIEINYFFEIRVQMRGGNDLIGSVPLTIGTVPLTIIPAKLK